MSKLFSRLFGACGWRRAAVAVVPALVLYACQPAVYSLTQGRAYSPSEFKYAAEGKDLRTVVKGNPFDIPDGAFEAMVLEAMQPAHWAFELARTPRTRFTSEPDGSAKLDYRVEVDFLAGALVAPGEMCERAEAPAQAAHDGRVQARMVFCYRDQLLSTSVGGLTDVAVADDPRLLRMVARMTRDLFPHRDYRRSSLSEQRD